MDGVYTRLIYSLLYRGEIKQSAGDKFGLRHLDGWFLYRYTEIADENRRRKAIAVEMVRNRMLDSLREGGDELGNLKTYPMASLNLHKDKLEHTV
jgi:hypothetical protein